MNRGILLAVVLALPAVAIRAEELRYAGALGNSEGDQAIFSGKTAPGMGPVIDPVSTIWERGGSNRLNRYALDGRLLASYEIPDSVDRGDGLVMAGDRLLLKIGRALYSLAIDAVPGTKAERIGPAVDLMSSGSFEGRVVVFEKGSGELSWLDPAAGILTPIVKPDMSPSSLFVDGEGTVYAFAGGEVHAWKDGQPLSAFPKGFNGERPQKIGDHWYSHSWHGTIHRMNDQFEPDPGVVLGGASGSFIGYLPQSADLTNGRGLVRVKDDLYAVSGMGGVVQILRWNEAERRFEVARRLGALVGLTGLAIDASGTIWTPRGSWLWTNNAETPHTIGDKEPEVTAQPVVLGGKTLCLLKKHYQYVQLARGPLIDASGWSRLETQAIKDFDLPASVTGAAAVVEGGKRRIFAVTREGMAFELGVSADGQLAGQPRAIRLPGLKDCTSLAWFEGRLLAADRGELVSFVRKGEDDWKEEPRRGGFGGGEIFVHSDGKRLVVSDEAAGKVLLFDSLGATPVVYEGLDSPGPVAVAGDRVAVYEEGRQRLVKLLHVEAPETPRTWTMMPAPKPSSVAPEAPGEAEYEELGRPGGIPLAIAVRTNPGKSLRVSVRTPSDSETAISLGVAVGDTAWVLDGKKAKKSDGRHEFELPSGDETDLRIAAAVALPEQQERFGFIDPAPIHERFNSDPSTWAPFYLDGYREKVKTRQQEIRLTFEQNESGKATLVIEDEAGRRVRNLVSGLTYAAGRHTVVWDGLDEKGTLVSPGTYRWRGLSHPGIKPLYRMNFANGDEPTTESWGPNHSTLHHAVSRGDRIFFAAPVTEGGWALLALDAEGRWVQGYEHQQGFGIQHNAIAVDDRYLYCAQDGFAWGGGKDIDPRDPKWKSSWTLTVVRFDIASGKLVEFPGKRRAIEVDRMEIGPGSDHPDLDQFNLGGLAAHEGKLYVGSRDERAVLVYDPESGERVDSIRLEGVRHLASGPSGVVAVTDRGIERVGDQTLIVPAGGFAFAGLTVAPNGDLLASDAVSHQIHRFTSAGKPVSVIGKPGGPYRGAYDPERMVHPAGLAVGPDGKLWVTEKRWNPKRVLAWDLDTGKVVHEKFGMPHYGGDGSGFDPENPRRWIGLGCFWDVDLETRKARPTHVLSLEEGHLGGYEPHSYLFFREGGRTFVSTRGKIALVSEVLPDGTLHDLVATAGTHHFAYAFKWKPPQAYIEAFYAKWPEKRAGEKPGSKGEGKPWAQRGMGVLWVDRNGDGEPQQEEFDFCGDQIDYCGGPWGHLQQSLTFTVPASDKAGVKLVSIAPRGFLANGVPDYPTLDEAIAAATPIGLTPGYKRNGVATVRDRFGRFLFNSDPEMNAFAADGSTLWTFPNQWSDVHGSHDAPLPEPGVMQGNLAFLGVAPLDETSDVVFLNGNHGRCFLLTTDGLYLDEAFVDVRVSYLKNEYRLGGEIFGGSFGRSATYGAYLVQIGHGPYRVYDLTGFDRVRRFEGAFEVTAEQIAAAERRSRNRLAEGHEQKIATIPGKLRWNKSGQFPVEVDLAADATHLRLVYKVQDSSPWINHGRDWTKLFATGDTVDLQIATDPAADPKRRGPVVGDRRLSIAPFEGKAVAVLYEHRRPGGENPIEFTSPWRGEKVDSVRRLDGVQIEVKTSDGGYEAKVAIPLADLGLDLAPGMIYRADFGVTYGDAGGTDTNLRSYWSNQSTGLVDDIPGEIMLSPDLWGEVRFEGVK